VIGIVGIDGIVGIIKKLGIYIYIGITKEIS
jgi:hypothetical protein